MMNIMVLMKIMNMKMVICRMTQDGTLSIYETPACGLLDKKSIKVAGMRGFSWFPKENILAYWVAEDMTCPPG